MYVVAEMRLLFETSLIKSDLRFHVPDLWLLKHGTHRPLNLLPPGSDRQLLKGIPAQGKRIMCVSPVVRGDPSGDVQGHRTVRRHRNLHSHDRSLGLP